DGGLYVNYDGPGGTYAHIDLAPARLASLRALLNAGVVEQLHASAAAWKRGDTEPPAHAPSDTTLVRVKQQHMSCSFPLALFLQVSAAIERDQQRLGITQGQVFKIATLIAPLIEGMFDEPTDDGDDGEEDDAGEREYQEQQYDDPPAVPWRESDEVYLAE